MNSGLVVPHWVLIDIAEHIDLGKPGIYEWKIEHAGSYIGKSKRLPKRFREYPNNVRKIEMGLPYRARRPSAFRNIHHELARAVRAGRLVTFRVIENCSRMNLNAREQFWIKQRGTLNRSATRPYKKL